MNLIKLQDVTTVTLEDTAYRQNSVAVFEELKPLICKYEKYFEEVIVESSTEEVHYPDKPKSKLCHACRVIPVGSGVEFKFSFTRAIDLIKVFKENGYTEIDKYHWDNGHFTARLKKGGLH